MEVDRLLGHHRGLARPLLPEVSESNGPHMVHLQVSPAAAPQMSSAFTPEQTPTQTDPEAPGFPEEPPCPEVMVSEV